jgi:crotonobetainyl-CoA:carnitine CoA-transferase CaiB-like acyl-CoA transferase
LLEVLRGEMAEATKKLTLAEAAQRFAAEDVPFARARRLTELHEDPQIAHNQVFSTLEHPTAGTLRQARPAPQFGRTPAAPGGPAPVSGQHTREILAELGLGDRIEDWLARGIVAAP